MKLISTLIALSALFCGHLVAAEKKPLKVFILAGQSNLEGQARVETFDYIGDDPATAPLLKMMRDADGKPRVCEHVWISYFTGPYDAATMVKDSASLQRATAPEKMIPRRMAEKSGRSSPSV